MRRRLAILLIVSTSLCVAQTSYERLAAAAKLWAFVKYLHPRVTVSEVDWDAAFVKAAPKVLEAKTDEEFGAAVNLMLAALKDPATRVAPFSEPSLDDQALLPVLKLEDEVTVLRMEKGDISQAMQAKGTLGPRLKGATAMVFDLRGSKFAQYVLPDTLPVAKASVGPSFLTRRHSGYANEAGTGSGGYLSLWETREGLRLKGDGGMRPVFLVNHETTIPAVALAVQNLGAGAIVSEDPIDESQFDLTRRVPVLGKVGAVVRVQELRYMDGTTGVAANLVLQKKGDEALQAAKELAKSGTWPAPAGRTKLELAPAMFTERNYTDQPYPASEYRLLAAARIWAVFHYFHPYQHLYGEDWDAVLTDFFPKMARAENAREYQLAVAEMITHTHDSHCFVGGAELAGLYGMAPAGVEVRWIENRPVITRVVAPDLKDLKPGDVVTKIEGQPVQQRIEELERYITSSTPQALKNRVTSLLLNGPTGSSVRVGVRTGDGPEREVTVPRSTSYRSLLYPPRSGEIFRLLTSKIGYVDLERLPNGQVDAMFEKFKDTDSIIMDMRGYPQGTAWSIAPRLAEKPAVVAAQFRRNVVTADSVEGNDVVTMMFEQRIPTTTKPRYAGKTVMLIDERAISQSEHSGLFYRAANGTVFIGTPTQGANGDVTYFMAPGGVRISFTGHDVRWPDGKQLQRLGLTPDVEVRPTIAGIQAGRDEILERAVVYLEKGR